MALGAEREARFRPVVAIDVYGVLIAPLSAEYGEPLYSGCFRKVVTFSRGDFPRMIEQPEWDEQGHATRRFWFHRAGVEWVKELVGQGVEVVWASLWGEHANRYFGQALGLPYLESVLDPYDAYGATLTDVKVRQIAKQYPGRPVLLTVNSPATSGEWDALGVARGDDPGPSLLEVIPFYEGGTASWVDGSNAWLKCAATPEGHARIAVWRQARIAYAKHDPADGGDPPWLAPYSLSQLIGYDPAEADRVELTPEDVIVADISDLVRRRLRQHDPCPAWEDPGLAAEVAEIVSRGIDRATSEGQP